VAQNPAIAVPAPGEIASALDAAGLTSDIRAGSVVIELRPKPLEIPKPVTVAAVRGAQRMGGGHVSCSLVLTAPVGRRLDHDDDLLVDVFFLRGPRPAAQSW
jgi:hypothetical protein